MCEEAYVVIHLMPMQPEYTAWITANRRGGGGGGGPPPRGGTFEETDPDPTEGPHPPFRESARLYSGLGLREPSSRVALSSDIVCITSI